jgi:hypothetical protein
MSRCCARSRGVMCSKEMRVDILFLTVLAVFLLLALALIAGCAALERRK